MLVFLGIVPVTLIGIIAAVACGFIHGRSVAEAVPEFTNVVGCLRPLSDFGREIRAQVGGIPRVDPVTNQAPRTSSREIVAPVAANVVRYAVAEKSAQRFADGVVVADEADALEKQPVAQPVLPRAGRTADPALRHFRSNGRKGRTIGQ